MVPIMKRALSWIVPFLGLLATASGCSTIYFHNDSKARKQVEYEEWHHVVALRLAEVSAPVDLGDRCGSGSGWETVKVEQNFVQGLISGVTSGLYDPWGVSYACMKSSGR